MTLDELDLDRTLARIAEEIDRYRAGPRAAPRPVRRSGRVRSASAARRGALVAVAASVVVAVGVAGVATLGRGGGDGTGTAPTTPVESPPTLLASLVEPLLPDGFVMVRATGTVPLVATAIRPDDGVRLDVSVVLGQADLVRGQLGDDGMTSIPSGEQSSDGSTVLTTLGDVVQVIVTYGGQPPRRDGTSPAAAVEAEAASRGLAAQVAAALDQDRRDELAALAAGVNGLGTAGLRADVQHTLETATGGSLFMSGGADPGNFQLSFTRPGGTIVTLTAIASSVPLPEGVVRPSERAVTATARENGWIVQLVDDDPTASGQVLSDAEIDQVMATLRPVFAGWSNEVPRESSCGTYTIVGGDSIAGIAAQFGVSVESLYAANADLDTALLPGTTINLPCATADDSAVAPPVATEDDASAAVAPSAEAALPYLVLDPVPERYQFAGAMRGAFGKDFEPPALLLAWQRDEGELTPLTVGVAAPDAVSAVPVDGEPVDSGPLTGWIWRGDGVTTAQLQQAEGPTYHLYVAAGDVPGEVLIDVVAALEPDGSMTWQGDGPDRVVEIARQDADAEIHAATYRNGEREITVRTLTAVPVNGLTLTPGTTVTAGISIAGGDGFALIGPGESGAAEITVYWQGDDGTVVSIGGTGSSLDELTGLADHLRPASPAEGAEFQPVP